MRPTQLLAALFAVSSVSAAWPDVFDNANALADVKNVIYGRQEKSSEAEKPSATPTPAPKSTANSEEPQSTGESKETNKPSGSEKPTETGKETGKQTGKATGSATKSTGKPKSFGNGVPPGGVQMVTPAPIAGTQYYKIGDWVTFAWNYTNLSVTPTAIDVLASCSKNQGTYTIAVNQTAKETGMVLWDTKPYEESGPNPLLTAEYTLLIYDSESSVTAVPRPGYLAPYSQFRFGMYQKQKYVPWSEFKCANCNSAVGNMALNALLLTCGTTIGSMLYFAYSFGVF